MTTRIKICGITRLEDAQAAVEFGAHALGFVFYEPSPRYVSPETAAQLIAQLPPFVTTTALFVNASKARIEAVMAQTGIDLLQFHGDEPEAFCRTFKRPYIKALRMKSGLDLDAAVAEYPTARGILLDAYRPDLPGGTGEAFDWDRIPVALRPEIILAGGLAPENVASAVSRVRPYAVDVSGGVERSKGIKDANKIKLFIEEVTRADKS